MGGHEVILSVIIGLSVSRSLSPWSVLGFVNLNPYVPWPLPRASLFLVVLLCTCLVWASCFFLGTVWNCT